MSEARDCAKCFYNRPMRAWGETFDACWYKTDNPGAELYGADTCSGFDPAAKQLSFGDTQREGGQT